MGSGRKAKAPCGHLGETIIGTYVQCLKCDKAAAPKRTIAHEKTLPMRRPVCPGCLSMDIEEFDTDIDAAMWFIQSHRTPSSNPMPPQAKEWGCHACGLCFPKPR